MRRRNLIIGTAGHIDHGKTVLVKALTGRDTDRLAEEKRRGISIDLGFAPLTLPGGTAAGLVDVPGHENFVRNMMAGATGVDLALLVVAADDGVMPQTREHLAILDLLGVRRGVIAITKVDTVDEEMVELVRDEVSELLEGTALVGSPMVAVSGVTGQGVDELMEALDRVASEVILKDEALPARMPIDRVFTLRGIGTVVTGTLWSGVLDDEERMDLLPRGGSVRVRGLQVHDAGRERAYAGERVAANLAGVPRERVLRGDVLIEPGYLRPTYMLDARVKILKAWTRPVKRGARIRFHHGTREILGRIYPMGAEQVSPGESVPCQLRLEAQAVCAPGDRFVIRSYSPVTTIGGGVVVDPYPPKHRISDERALVEFAALEEGDPAESTAVYLGRSSAPVTADGLVLASGMSREDVEAGLKALVSDGHAFMLGRGPAAAYLSSGLDGGTAESVVGFIDEFHRSRPLEEGIARDALKKKLLASWEPRAADLFLDRMAAAGLIEIEGKSVRLPGAGVSVSGEDGRLMDDILARIESAGYAPPSLGELAEALGKEKRGLVDLLSLAQKEGRLVRVSPDLYYTPKAMSEIEKRLRQATGSGTISVSDFRGVIGASRKYALPLLEYFDRNRVTVRVGDVRKLR
ncbi:MAG: selenocysteine-specific translation elongation factor [Actinobacteria bacterium]|nr:selenocysteine-specific translation elongation factor [Actinomycetota bacterium]MBU1943125.1 selenocysteine-specific translation elongation factor [Actinomycetota bacterium]MBU2687928.1 selenocysteine-specific translation elongation factor [Actinomycetota bacterium]